VLSGSVDAKGGGIPRRIDLEANLRPIAGEEKDGLDMAYPPSGMVHR
jgi:hypothetical protein